jgi:hypothetical protein
VARQAGLGEVNRPGIQQLGVVEQPGPGTRSRIEARQALPGRPGAVLAGHGLYFRVGFGRILLEGFPDAPLGQRRP